MSNGRGGWFRGTAVVGIALIAGCVSGPVSPSPVSPPPVSPALASSAPGPSSSGSDARPGVQAALERVPDSPTLHGDAVGGPRLVTLPGGGFLMLKKEDMPSGGSLLRSDDGRTWRPVDARSSGLDAGAIEDLAASATTVVILGTAQPLSGTGTDVPELLEWTSADGVTWTRVPDAGPLQAIGAGGIVGSPQGFAAVGDARLTILLSGPDGRTWRATDVPVAQGARGSVDEVAPTGDGFLAVGTVEGRSVLWRWAGAGWFPVPLARTDAISSVVAGDGRIIVTGTIETPDPLKPDQPVVGAVAWQSVDDGVTWTTTGLALGGITDIAVFAIGGAFLAVLSPGDWRRPSTAWQSIRPGAWEPVTFAAADDGQGRPFVSALAMSGRRVVLAGNTVGTGAGGDRVIVWIGDTTGP
jgi:hypothetical protein